MASKLAMLYFESLNQAAKKFNSTKGKEFDNFVISKDNFQMRYQSKKVEEYKTFYQRLYK